MVVKKQDRFLCSVNVKLEFLINEGIIAAELVVSKVNKKLTVIRRKV